MLKYFMLVAILFLSSFTLHPIHVSVCDIEYDQDRKALEIVQRIFLDDLEKAIRSMEGKPDLNILKPAGGKTTDEWVKSYLKQNFKVSVNGKETEHRYLGHEVEGDALYAYLEVEKVKKLNSIKVYSAILTSEYDDQVNLVHIKADGKIRSMKLTEKNKTDVLKYED